MRREPSGLKKKRAYKCAKMSDENVMERSARLEKCGLLNKRKAVRKVCKATHLDWKERKLSCLLKLHKDSPSDWKEQEPISENDCLIKLERKS